MDAAESTLRGGLFSFFFFNRWDCWHNSRVDHLLIHLDEKILKFVQELVERPYTVGGAHW